jgi:hypothetical protein
MHCIWRFGDLRRRLLGLGLWPACENPPRPVMALLRAAAETPFVDPLRDLATLAPSSFTTPCNELCKER